MYLPFIKYFFGFIVFVVPIILFYTTIKSRLPKSLFWHVAYWAVPSIFLSVFVIFRYFATFDFFFSKGQILILWTTLVYLAWFKSFLIFAVCYWLDLLLGKIFRNKNFRLKYFVAIPSIFFTIVLLIWGVCNRHNLEVRETEIFIKNLPPAFEGTKIAVFSDLHLGNLNSEQYVENVVDCLNKADADLVLFAGDLINSGAAETKIYAPILSKIKSKYGNYSVMGNHDFCKYYRWNSEEIRKKQIAETKEAYKNMGMPILDNSYVLVEKDSINSICIIGVDEKTDIRQIMKNVPKDKTKILLFHDPHIWDKLITDQNIDIDLTVSGHTHALQFAFDIFGKKVSPASLLFSEWDGKYTNQDQTLFVTRGVGYVGVPVRIGLNPEISILTLKTK